MDKLNVTLDIDTVGSLCEGATLEYAMQSILEKIVNEEEGTDIEDQVYLARKLVALRDLLEAIEYARASELAKRRRGLQ
tara:strand:+ start:958 stop:1194 length:237 start_codon:yes stop_codon:yes gene_type:complete